MSSPEPPRRGPELLRSLLRLRASRTQLLVAALCGLLGFALAMQVIANRGDAGLAGARPQDLVGILGDLQERSDRLRQEIATLEQTQARLRSGSASRQAALAEARRRAQTLGILTGTLPATGTGIVLTVTDPQRRLPASVLVDILEELRDAGGEAMQLGGVRVIASTAVTEGRDGALRVDGRRLVPPYRFLVIGDPQTLQTALKIPGGVVDTVAQYAGEARVASTRRLTIRALRPLSAAEYARPAAG